MWNGRTEKSFYRSLGSAKVRMDTLQTVGSEWQVAK
jgi:hypothetical protein